MLTTKERLMKSKAASSIKTVVSVKIGLVFTTSCWKVVAAEAVLIPMLMMLFWRKDVVLQMHVMANKSKGKRRFFQLPTIYYQSMK